MIKTTSIGLLLLTALNVFASAQSECLEASRLSQADTMNVCEAALKEANISLNEQSIIYITEAEFLIRHSQYTRANEILEIAFNANPEMLKNGFYRLNWLRIMGSLYVAKEEFANALPYYQQALDVAENMQDDSLQANGYNDLGAVYLELGNYDLSLLWLKQSLSIHQRHQDHFRTGLSLANVAEVYQLLGNTEQALYYYQASLKAHQTNLEKQANQIAFYEPYVAQVHQDIGNIMSETNTDEAVIHYQLALAIYQKYQMVRQQVRILSSLGQLNLKRKQTDQALVVLQQAWQLEQSLESEELVELKLYRAQALFAANQWQAAQNLAEAGLVMARAKNNSLIEAELLTLLSQLAESQHDYKTALELNTQLQQISAESLKQKFNQSMLKHQNEIDALQRSQEVDELKNQQATQQLKNKQQLWLFVCVAVILLSWLAYLFLTVRRNKQLRLVSENDQADHSQQLELLSNNRIPFVHLFHGFNSPLICFDSSGHVFYQTHLDTSAQSGLNMEQLAPVLWSFILTHLNTDEQLEADILFENNHNNEAIKYAWIHQLGFLDDVMVTVIFDDKLSPQAMIEASQINQYDEYRSLLTDALSHCQHMAIHHIDQFKKSHQALASEQIKTDKKLTHSADEINIMAVEMMNLCLQIWHQSTGKHAIELAEESGLWSVTIDEGRIRIRTMERYLDLSKFPQKPRWQPIIKTAHFILSTCKLGMIERQQLNKKVEQFKAVLYNRIH